MMCSEIECNYQVSGMYFFWQTNPSKGSVALFFEDGFHLIGVNYICKQHKYVILFGFLPSRQIFTQEACVTPPRPYVLPQFIYHLKVSSARWSNRRPRRETQRFN